MCGISGILDAAHSRDAVALEEEARRMAETLRHRGPDDAGCWVDAERGVALGHRRLAVIDLSESGRQPMVSAYGRYVLCCNGEIYNFLELRRELEALGHAFRGHSDMEVALAAFTQWGFPTALARLTGMFALAIWDRQESTLHLARDRLGEKPLYYGRCGTVFLFGSELRALRAHPAMQAEIDPDSLVHYFRYGYIPAPGTIYRGVRKLPPGTWLTLRAGGGRLVEDPQPIAYWDLLEVARQGLANPIRARGAALLDELDNALQRSVAMCRVADVPLGAFLSGGIDSSLVVATMQSQSAQPVRTFTIGFHEAGFNEAEHAKAVARHLGTDHTELYVTPRETLDVVPDLPEVYDEPFADPSQVPMLLLSRMTRRGVTVSLSGDGGDELFGGYARYATGERAFRMLTRTPWPARRLAQGALQAVPAWAWGALRRSGLLGAPGLRAARDPARQARKLAHLLGAPDLPQFYRALISHWLVPTEIVPGARESGDALLAAAAEPWTRDVRESMMLADMGAYLPDDILVKVDRAAMSVGLESRVPLLDHRLVELAWRVPTECKFRGGTGKAVLRGLLARHLPPELFDRPKSGFSAPVGQWLRGPLRDWAESLLDESRLRQEGVLAPAPIRRKWREHLRGQVNWEYPLWDVLMFQAWHEHQRRSAGRSAAGADPR